MADIEQKILDRLSRQYEEKDEYNQMMDGIDSIVDMNWEPPDGFIQQWSRISIDTSGHDVIKAASNIFDTQTIKWDVMPMSPTDNIEAEKKERWLEWQFYMLNKRSNSLRRSLDHALRYDMIAGQVDYLPHWSKKEAKKAKGSPFVVRLFHPKTVYYEFGDYGLEWAAMINNVLASDVVNYWRKYGEGASKESKKISAAVKKLEELISDDYSARVMFVDYTDCDSNKRLVYAYPTSGTTIDDNFDSGDKIILIDSKKDIPFSTWVISEGRKDPILRPLYDAGLWSNSNLMNTAIESEVFKTLYMPSAKEITMDGEPKEEDYTGSVSKWTGRQGEDYQPLQVPPIDPRKREIAESLKQKILASTGLKNILNFDIVGNLQYATLNAMLQMALSMLEAPRRLTEHFWGEVACKMFEWMDFKGDSVPAMYMKDSQNFRRGSEIMLTPDDYDASRIYISCQLLPNTPSDKVQRVNFASQIRQAFPTAFPDSELIEMLNLGNPEVMKPKRLKEIIEDTALNNYVQQKSQDLQLQFQAQQMQLQMEFNNQQQMAAAQAQGMMPPESGMMEQGQGQGFNPAGGGIPPAMAMPEMTQTGVQQQNGDMGMPL